MSTVLLNEGQTAEIHTISVYCFKQLTFQDTGIFFCLKWKKSYQEISLKLFGLVLSMYVSAKSPRNLTNHYFSICNIIDMSNSAKTFTFPSQIFNFSPSNKVLGNKQILHKSTQAKRCEKKTGSRMERGCTRDRAK